MSDLVEQLRMIAPFANEQSPDREIIESAAGGIERLREALENVKQECEYCEPVARQALNQEQSDGMD